MVSCSGTKTVINDFFLVKHLLLVNWNSIKEMKPQAPLCPVADNVPLLLEKLLVFTQRLLTADLILPLFVFAQIKSRLIDSIISCGMNGNLHMFEIVYLCWIKLYSFLHAEPRLPPSGRPLQAAGLGGAEGPALVQAPQEPRQTQHTHQVLREHVGPHTLRTHLTSLQAWAHSGFVFQCTNVAALLYLCSVYW